MKPELKKAVRRAIERPEAVLLVRLRHRNSGSHLAVANLHVIWAELKYPALQSLQVSVAAAELAEFAKGFHCAQIICGDFNSHPDSIVYHMLSSGRLDLEMVDALRNSDSNLIEENEQICSVDLFDILSSAFTIKNKLKSAYKTALGCEPPITNCDDAGQSYLTKLCLDYIFYCPTSLEVAGVLDTPCSASITKHYALPSIDFPSDHIPLMAEIIFK